MASRRSASSIAARIASCCDERARWSEQRQLEPRPQPRQRRLQIVRDIVGDLAHPGHQPLDLIEHAVEIVGELVELVAAIVVVGAARHPVREIAGDDPLGGAVHLLDPAQHVAAHQRAAEQPDAERAQPRPQERRLDPVAERRRVADVAPDQKAIAVRDDEQRAARRMRHLPALLPHLDLERQRAGTGRHAGGPAVGCCRRAAGRHGW